MVSRMPGQYYNQPVSVLLHWDKLLDISGNPRLSQVSSGPAGNNPAAEFSYAVGSDYNYVDASFIRLKTLSFSYQFPGKMIKRIGAKECKLFLQGQNLFTITNYINLDPETGSVLPPLRVLSLGLNVKF
jgi:hypothetical protein